jgi:hypothetical protein
MTARSSSPKAKSRSKGLAVLRGEREKPPAFCRVHSGCSAPEKCREAGHCLDLAETLSPDR